MYGGMPMGNPMQSMGAMNAMPNYGAQMQVPALAHKERNIKNRAFGASFQKAIRRKACIRMRTD